MKKTFFPKNEGEKQFFTDYSLLTDRYHPWQVWKDFVDLTAYSIANAVMKPWVGADIWEKREESYLKIINQYPKNVQEVFPKLLADTVLALDDNPRQDFLGELYMRLDIGSDWHGQYFTPYHIAEFMAHLTLGEPGAIREQISEEGVVSVADSSCGAGVMLIAYANVCKDKGINYQDGFLFYGQDIDSVVAKMCFIQLSLLGCPGYVIIGDSLAVPPGGSTIKPIVKNQENIFYTPLYFRNYLQFL